MNHSPTTEPRQVPAQTIVFTFNKPRTGATAAVTEGMATAGASTFSRNGVVALDPCGRPAAGNWLANECCVD